MAIYVLNMLTMGIYSISYNFLSQKINSVQLKKFFVSLATIQLILLLSLRDYTIGVDVPGYIYKFQFFFPNASFKQLFDNSFELGFIILNKIIGNFTDNIQVFLSIISIISIVPVGRFIYKYSKMPFLSFALYICFDYYSFTFSGLRQGIAYGIILFSYDFIKQKKMAKFILIILFAGLFHKSALVFLPAFFVKELILNKKSMFIIITVDLVLFVFRRELFRIMINVFYDKYELIESASYTWLTLCTAILVFGLFFYRKVLSISPNSGTIYILLIIGISFMLFSTVGNNVMRIANYYYMFVVIFIPEVINAIKDKRKVVIMMYILLIFIFILYLLLLRRDGYSIVPYKFYW